MLALTLEPLLEVHQRPIYIVGGIHVHGSIIDVLQGQGRFCPYMVVIFCDSILHLVVAVVDDGTSVVSQAILWLNRHWIRHSPHILDIHKVLYHQTNMLEFFLVIVDVHPNKGVLLVEQEGGKQAAVLISNAYVVHEDVDANA